MLHTLDPQSPVPTPLCLHAKTISQPDPWIRQTPIISLPLDNPIMNSALDRQVGYLGVMGWMGEASILSIKTYRTLVLFTIFLLYFNSCPDDDYKQEVL